MNWSDIFLRGGRRLTDLRTYAILLAGIVAAGILALVLFLAGVDFATNTGSSSFIVLLVLASFWSYLVVTFIWGALAVSSLDGQPPTVSWVMGSTLARFPSFLAASFIVLLILVGTSLVLVLLALAVSSAPSLTGALTSVFLVGGGLSLLLVAYLWRMSFAAVAVDDCGGVEAIRRAWALARASSGEVVLYLAADTAISYGLAFGLVGPVLIGAQNALGPPAAFVLADTGKDAFDLGVATAFFVVSSIVFLLMAIGAVASFSAGSSVGFYGAASQHTEEIVAMGPMGQYCDQCGESVPNGSAFCDQCSAALV